MAESERGALIAFRSDRLGARLVSLMNAMRLAEDLGSDFRCAWIESVGVGDVFNDPTELFDADFVARHFLSPAEWKAARPRAENLTAALQQQPDAVARILDAGQDMIVGNAFGVIALKGEAGADVIDRFRAQFQRIPFAAPVAEAMRQVHQALTGHTAYHIRRGDLTDDAKAKHKPWPHKVVPNEFYERHIEASLAGEAAGAILFSDDAPSIARYKARFPALKTVADVVALDGLTEAQRDLFELYAMSCCATIIAPERSAFSSTAADLQGARKRAIGDAMGEAMLAEANQALCDRLAGEPDSFDGDGDIGQALAHAGGWLEGQERWADAAALFAGRVADGLNISFVYPQTMRFQHHAGDFAGVLQTAQHMAERSVIYIKDQATAELLHGYAHLRAGAREAAVRHIVNGFWHAPSVPAARTIVPMMAENGWLDAGNFLPVSRVQLDLQRRRGPLKQLFLEYPELLAQPGVSIPDALGSMDGVLWDWAPLMRSVSFPALVRQGAIERAEGVLASLTPEPGQEAEYDSIVAVMMAYRGENAAAVKRLTALARREDATFMTFQRLSHAHWLARRFRRAARTGEMALERAPDCSALLAWAGMTALRQREPDKALVWLERAAARCTGLPSIAFLRAQALDRLGRAGEAAAVIDEAMRLAPLEVDYAMMSARLCDGAGDIDGAIARLVRLVEAQRAPGKLFVQLIALLERKGDAGAAEEMTRLAHERAPKHPGVSALAAEAV